MHTRSLEDEMRCPTMTRQQACKMGRLGNQFEEESEDLPVLDSNEIVDPSAVEAVKKAQKIDQQQFQPFCHTRGGIWKTSFSMKTKHGHQRSPMEEDYDLVPRVSF